MHRSYPTFATLSFAALTALFAPTAASASPQTHKTVRIARVTKVHACDKPPIMVLAGAESATFSLSKCDGTASPTGVDQLSVLARPGSAPRPTEPIPSLGKARGSELAPGIRRVDPRLVEHLQLAVDHFRKDGERAHVVLVSGYRPRSSGSYHAAGRALDFRIEGVSNDALVAFCKTLPDTGCGYYPNSVFVHMDVREPGTGHIAWVDTSHPGEAPRFVSPPPSTRMPVGEVANDKPRTEATIGGAADEKLPPLPAAERARKGAAMMLSPGST
jgi:hypothetical protein